MLTSSKTMGLKSKLREKYQRFRKWQLNPFDYTNRNKHPERCANCGTEVTANYCPICGQKAGVGSVNWNTVRQGLTMIWGMDSRSLGYSLLQLVLRPGYLISDYICGKRQVSFPPVKMLLIVAIGVLVFDYIFEDPAEAAETAKDEYDALQVYGEWFEANPGWGMLSLSCLMLLPTWLLFRYAPKHRKHTLPEGFFIQVFMSTLMAIIFILSIIIDNVNVMWLLPFGYFIAYHQLFGYGWWGTLWRLLFCFIQSMVFIVLIGFISNFIIGAPQRNDLNTINVGISIFLILTFIWFIVEKKKAKREV